MFVKESPKPAASASKAPSSFSDLMAQYSYGSLSSSNAKSAGDMAAAYASSSRRPRPQPAKQIARPVNGVSLKSLDDIDDYDIRKKVKEIKDYLTWESIQRCFDAFKRKRNVQDAIEWLTADEEQDAPAEDDEDELASTTPAAKRGVAVAKAIPQSSQPTRPAAKQEVKAPSLTIAEKYGSTQANRRQSEVVTVEDADEDVKPRRRLKQGKKAVRSPTPPSSPPQKAPQPRVRQQQAVVISDDESESDSGIGREVSEVQESSHETRLLRFFNECSVQDLVALSAQPEEVVKFVLEQRPFDSLDVIRTVTNKTGKSRVKPIGDKIVEVCSEMWDWLRRCG